MGSTPTAPDEKIGGNSQQAGSATDPWTVPAAVRNRFAQEGHRFCFPDGAKAFQDHGRKLTTPSENTELIRSLVEIAKVRGWDTVVVGGTERFRQEAWRQARLEGLAVRGYRPSDPERAALSKSAARRQESREESLPQQTSTGNSDADLNAPGSAPTQESQKIDGRLLDHGRDTYRFDPHEEMSYFVRLATPEGTRTFWGKDLERAMAESLSKPKTGDDVALRVTGHDKVKVSRKERDAEGNLLKERNRDVHRNRWDIEKNEFLETREVAAAVVRDPRIQPKAAVQAHPQLAGTYLNLHAAEIAAKVLPDRQDQQRFVSLVRTALADAIERGEPLHPVQLRERVPERDARRAERTSELPVRS